MKFMYSPPEAAKNLFSGFRWNTLNKKVLLTFDDGPTLEATEVILRTLGEARIKALFMLVGSNVIKYPHLVRQMLSEGHTIGNHTMNHADVWFRKENFFRSEVDTLSSLLRDDFGVETSYFRPPHGRFDTMTCSRLEKRNIKNIMWSLLTQDYKNRLDIVKFAAENYLRKDSIVVLHDSRKSAAIIRDSINIILEKADKKGFIIGEPEECLN